MAFPTATGVLMRRSNFRRRWTQAIDACFAGTALEGLAFHELRHTCAALCIEAGAHPQTLKERLGHSSITVTMDTYGHLFPSADEALAEALDASFCRPRLASDWPVTVDLTQKRRSAAYE